MSSISTQEDVFKHRGLVILFIIEDFRDLENRIVHDAVALHIDSLRPIHVDIQESIQDITGALHRHDGKVEPMLHFLTVEAVPYRPAFLQRLCAVLHPARSGRTDATGYIFLSSSF